MNRSIRLTRRAPFGVLLTVVFAAVATACIPLPGTEPISSPPAPTGCITDVGPADRLVVTGCGGDITYDVSVPERCTTHACGLILDVHGWTMSGPIQESNTQIAAIGRERGYVVVQPSAPGSIPSWNSSHYPLVADFVEQAVEAWRIDERRVHVTGFSQGGAMTFWMRCNRADLFASAAPTAMAGTACADGTTMPTLYLQGLDDIFVSQAAIDNTIDSFVTRQQLDRSQVLFDDEGLVTTAYTSSTLPDQHLEVVIHSHSTESVLGHCIVGAPDPANFYGCDQPTEHTHGQMVVDFFERTPRRS